MSARRHPAGVAHYAGNVAHIVGEVKGPTSFGGFVVAESVVCADGRSTVRFAYLADADRERVVTDEHGIHRLPDRSGS